MSDPERNPIETKTLKLKGSISIEFNLFKGFIEIIHKNDFVFTANIEKFSKLMPDVPEEMDISGFYTFMLERLIDDCYSIEKTDKEFKIILEYLTIHFNNSKYKKVTNLVFDFIPQEKDQLTLIKEELEILKKKITPTMEKITSIINEELVEFYKSYPILTILSMISKIKFQARNYYFKLPKFIEAGRQMTTLDLLNYEGYSSAFSSKWNFLNPITKIIIADEVDKLLKDN